MRERPIQLAGALAAEERKLLACVHCGLCLEACPTYVETGDENDGPRGRIYLMRAVEEGRLGAESRSFTRHIERCLGCRACESVCPSGVEYGQLLEAAGTDSSVDASAVAAPSKAKAADDAKGSAEASGSAAMLFGGCVTEGLFARVNRATARVLEAQGCRTSAPHGQVCCGALHAHAGDLEGARELARRNVEAFEVGGDAPVVTNAGGCGAMLASYAHLL